MKRDEKLIICMEECGELVQVCSKVLRFGMREGRMDDLVEEIGDVLALIDLVTEELEIPVEDIMQRRIFKKAKLLKEYAETSL